MRNALAETIAFVRTVTCRKRVTQAGKYKRMGKGISLSTAPVCVVQLKKQLEKRINFW